MAWAAVNTKLLTMPGVRQLPTAAHKVLWLAGRLHCGEFETDGLIESAALPLLAFEAGVDVDQAQQLIRGLKETGLWTSHPKGWVDATFLDDNSSHEVRERARERDRGKKKRRRSSGLAPGDSTGGQHRGTSGGEAPGGVPKAQVQGEKQLQPEGHFYIDAERISPDDTAVGHAHSNGHNAVQFGDVGRQLRVRQILEGAVDACMFFEGSAEERWYAHIKQLALDLAARVDLSESTIGMRAKKFFDTQYWVHEGDSKQADYLRSHMLKAVPKKRRAAAQ
jgi:hypothetical protein